MNTSHQNHIRLGSRLFMFCLAVLISGLLALRLPVNTVLAAPVLPGRVELTQPDGTVIYAVPFGDEYYSGYEYLGYTILLDENTGYWVYAESEQGGHLVPGKARAGIDAVPTGLERNLRDEPAVDIAAAASAENAPAGAPPSGSFGAGKVLIILSDFTPSTSRGTTPAQWNAKFFDNTPGAKSVKNWYEQASYGQFTLDPVAETYGVANDGVIEVTLPYANQYPWPNETERTSVRDTLTLADPYVDFGALDTNHNGSIDNTELHLVLIVRGFEESYGGTGGACAPNVWGHRWSMPTGTCANCAPVLDGVTIGASAYNGGYTREGEWHEYLSDGCDGSVPGHIATMGIIVHELGHDIDWPDTYDTDYSSEGVGNWDIMAGGSWGSASSDLYSGETPVLADPFLKWYQGWLTPVQVKTPSASVAIPNSAQNNTVYQLGINPNGIDWNANNNSGTGEYFLVENRQQVGFDAGLRKISSNAKGCMIWHIDETRTYQNTANADETRKLVDVEEANGTPQNMDIASSSGGNRGDSGDPWPGITGKIAFSGTSDPNSNWYDGSTSGIAISNISTAGTGCTLDFSGLGVTWNGSINSNWSNANNWSTGRVPNQNDNVIIPSGVPNWPNVDTAASAYNINILDGAHLNAAADVSLDVYGNWIEQGSGYFNASAGTVVFRGNSTQAITSQNNSHFNHLQIGNGSTFQTVTAASDLDVNGNLTISSGAKLAAGSYTLHVAGNWTDNPFGFDPGTGTVILDGASQTIQRATTGVVLYSNDLSSTTGWTIYDANGNASTWYYSTSTNGPNIPDHGGHYRYQQPLAGDDWAFSPGVTLQAGVTYNIGFNYASMGTSWREKLAVHVGNAQTVAAMATQVFDNNNITNTTWQPGTGTFTPTTSGTYYVGFHVYSDPSQYKVGFDDLQITASDPNLHFYNLTVANGSTVTLADNAAITNNATVNAAGTLALGTYNVTVDGAVTNNGALAQTRTVNASSTSFLNVKNGAGTADAYWGAMIEPGTNNLGSTTLTIRGNQLCPSATGAVKRCFDLSPTTSQPATVTYYYTEGERNGGDNASLSVYHWNGSAWEKKTGTTTRGGSGDSQWVRVQGIDAYSPFMLSSNHAPIAIDDSYTTNKDTPLTISAPGILSNDTDADSNPLTALKVSDPAHGTLTLNADGSFTYTPAVNYTGPDSFTYKANDGTEDSNIATIAITVIAPNTAPVAVADTYSTNENAALTIAAPGVLANDTDANNDAFTAIKVADPAHGTLTLNADGSFVYTPAAGYNGPDSFTYKTNDGKADSNTATVNITVVPNEYTLTVNSAHGTVTKSPDKLTYHYGEEVTLSVTPSAGWTFTGWTPTLTNNKVTIAGDTTVTANFTQNEYTLTILKVGNGTITRDNDGPYHLNDVVTLTAVADPGWTFTNWTPGLTNNKVTITGNTTVTANFMQNEYELTVISAHGMATKSPDKLTYHYGDEVTLTVTPAAGWTFTGWMPALPENKITITGNATVTANFTQNEYALIVNAAHGTVTKVPEKPTYHYGEEVTLSVTAENGWTFTGWTPVLTDNKVTISGDTTITANFTQNQYTLTVNSAHGSVVKNPDKPTYHYGEEVILSVTADNGWTLTGWSPALTDNKVTITGDTAVTANFTQNEYDLTITSAHGSVTKSPDKATYHYGEEVTLSVTAENGWTFTGWTPALTDNKVTITGDTTITANFTQNEYTLTILKVGNGTVTRDNNGPYHLNDVVKLTATADAGWTFTGWMPELTDNKVTITGDTTVTANFVQNEYTLTVNSVHGTVTPDHNGPYHLNDVVTLTVLADPGWTFTNWTPDLMDNKITITGDTTVTANYSQNAYTLSIASAHGTVVKSPDKAAYSYGEEVQLTVTPDTGWSFVNWSGDATGAANPVSVTMDGNKSVTANYSQHTYTLTVISDHGAVTKSPNQATYQYGDVVTLNVIADTGWIFTGWMPALIGDKVTITGDTTVTANYSVSNTAPFATNDSYTTDEDHALTIASLGVLENDIDVDSDALTAVLVDSPLHGTLTLNANGSFSYTPNANWNGADSFTYKAKDALLTSNMATVSLVVNAVNDAPVAVDDTASTTEGATVTVNALANDSDIEGDTLSVIAIGTPVHGSVVINPDKTLTYTPSLFFNGSDEFTYTVSDGKGGTAVAKVIVTVGAVNDAPIAGNDIYPTDEDKPLTIAANGVLANDSDPDGDALTTVLVSNVQHGTLSLLADGSFTYTPTANFNGTDSFTYKANDGQIASNIANVTITVSPINDAPVANAQSVSVDEDNALSITLTGSDVDGDTLTFTVATNPTHGILSGTAPDLTYTPNANFNGTDSFTFQVSDGFLSATAEISITVKPINDAPIALLDAYETDENAPLVVSAPGVLANDTDVDGDPLTAVLVSSVSHGSLEFNSDGSFTYTPQANFNGEDSFTYKANDGKVDSNGVTGTIKIHVVNYSPVAINDAYSTDEDTVLMIPAPGVLGNDTDADGDALSAIKVTDPAHGALVLNSDGSFTYSPVANWNGTDTFTYKVTDGIQESNAVEVTIVVKSINDAPTANAQAVTLDEDTQKAVTLTGSDVDGDPLTFMLVTNPANGALSGTASSLTYAPNANFFGDDSFTFTVNDGHLTSALATVNIHVNPVNDAPVCLGLSLTTNEDVAGTISPSCSDVDSTVLSYQIVASAGHGTASVSGGSLVYNPDANYNGTDGFTYKANDGVSDSNTANVAVTVKPVNDAPLADSQNVTTDQNTSKAITLTGSDIENSSLTFTIVTGPAHGSLSGSAPSVIYTPAGGYSGSDSFTFKVNDGALESNVATVSIVVTAANHAPVAANDAYNILANTTLAIAAPGVLSNDADADHDPLTAVKVTNPAHGTLTLNANGSFIYVPAVNYVGSDSFTYKANDGKADSNTATVNIVVKYNFSGFYQPVDNAPVENQMKAGSSVPIKFSLGGNMGLNIFVSGYPAVKAISCVSGAPIDDVEVTTSSNSGLKYDAATGQYIYTWKTDKKLANTCQQFTLRLIDGTEAIALFKFK